MEQEIFTSEELSTIGLQGNPETAKQEPEQKKVTFKPYSTLDNYLFPPSTNDYIARNHIARFVSRIIDKVGVDYLIDKYKGGGASAFHPAMLLKVRILGCIYRIYTCRKLEHALQENIAFIWISGNQRPDFRTLNNFRLRLEDDIKKIFKEIVGLCIKFGFIDGEEIFIDHTKLEANANRHKITWRKYVEKRLEKYEKEIDELFLYINEMNLREDQELESCTQNKEWNEEELDEAILLINKQINENQREKDKGREIKKSLRRAKEVIKKKAQNQIRLSILGDRNSYSNTDLDGTARCQKDKISIKPGYNEGIATNNSFVVNFEVSQRGGDTSNFIDLIKGAKDNLEEKPGLVHSDGAYGSEENMTYLEKEGIGNYLKYNTYRREHSKKWHQERVRKEDFLYDHENDRYRCPGGKYLNFYLEQEKKTTNGFLRRLRRYQADKNDCRDCPFKQSCTTNDSRGIEVSPHYERLKAQARENLGSERGKELCRRRGFEVETTPLKL